MEVKSLRASPNGRLKLEPARGERPRCIPLHNLLSLKRGSYLRDSEVDLITQAVDPEWFHQSHWW